MARTGSDQSDNSNILSDQSAASPERGRPHLALGRPLWTWQPRLGGREAAGLGPGDLVRTRLSLWPGTSAPMGGRHQAWLLPPRRIQRGKKMLSSFQQEKYHFLAHLSRNLNKFLCSTSHPTNIAPFYHFQQ